MTVLKGKAESPLKKPVEILGLEQSIIKYSAAASASGLARRKRAQELCLFTK
jgi:hypothetical protein